ncbi:MAG: hypothetical protein IAE86_19895 [Burkholderiaceae bacterium]|nr:hypothetical protein [Burkholderiaceae bacterium]
MNAWRAQVGVATSDPRNEAHFGPEPAAWEAASIVDHVDVAPFPLWISFAERDLLQMQVQMQTGDLFARHVTLRLLAGTTHGARAQPLLGRLQLRRRRHQRQRAAG